MKTKYFFILIFLKLINVPFLFSDGYHGPYITYDANGTPILHMQLISQNTNQYNVPLANMESTFYYWGNSNPNESYKYNNLQIPNFWEHIKVVSPDTAIPSMSSLNNYVNNNYNGSIGQNLNNSVNPTYVQVDTGKDGNDFPIIERNAIPANIRKEAIELTFVELFSENDIKTIYGSQSNVYLFSRYHLYSNAYYLAYIRTLPRYTYFILRLRDKIDSDHDFRKSLHDIPGFKGKKGFPDFIVKEEAKRVEDEIKKQEIEDAKRREENKKLNAINLNISEKSKYVFEKTLNSIKTNDLELLTRYGKRVEAFKAFLEQNGKKFDYSKEVKHPAFTDPYAHVFDNCYGTALDKQLHEELCDTREKTLNLNSQYSNNFHIQSLSPVIFHFTALAKVQCEPELAFGLSDFCSDLTQVISTGIHILSELPSYTGKGLLCAGKGLLKGTKTVLSLEHWKEMAYGSLQLGALFIQELAREAAFDDAFHKAAISGDSKTIDKVSNEYYLHRMDQINAVKKAAQETYKKIASMPWQELVENGVALGTTLMLDTLALNALSGFVSTASRVAVKQLSNVIKNGTEATERFAVEATGFGKLMIEEGPEPIQKALDIITNNPSLVEKEESLANATQKFLNGQTGTVWDCITNCGPMYNDMKIPKYFDLTVGKQKFWVTPNATEHMMDYFTKRISHGIEINCQSLLESLKASVEKALELKNLYTDEPILIDCWELMFSPSLGKELFPAIKHAVYKPK